MDLHLILENIGLNQKLDQKRFEIESENFGEGNF